MLMIPDVEERMDRDDSNDGSAITETPENMANDKSFLLDLIEDNLRLISNGLHTTAGAGVKTPATELIVAIVLHLQKEQKIKQSSQTAKQRILIETP